MTSEELKAIRYRMETPCDDVSPITDRMRLLEHIEALEGKLKVAEEKITLLKEGMTFVDSAHGGVRELSRIQVTSLLNEAHLATRGAP